MPQQCGCEGRPVPLLRQQPGQWPRLHTRRVLGDQGVGGRIHRQLKCGPAKRRRCKRSTRISKKFSGYLLGVLDEVPPVRLQPPEDILGERCRLDGRNLAMKLRHVPHDGRPESCVRVGRIPA